MRTYDGAPMRDVLLERLAPTAHSEFLVYVMGPYTTFRLDYYLRDNIDVDEDDIDLGAFGDAETDLLDELRAIVEWLRTEIGVNAFLAVDPAIPTENSPAETDQEQMNVIRSRRCTPRRAMRSCSSSRKRASAMASISRPGCALGVRPRAR